ncbi:MAG: universal stress protein [Candidatus Tectimicrobiota bacterium]|nr:MAG: universal stress protein [Candidatus Tectomicrobia bacterium]
MYKRILVATGGSPWSDAAVAYAVALSAKVGAELRILTVLVGPMTYTMPDVMSSSELLVESIERQGQALLVQAAARAAQVGVVHSTHIKWGNVTEAILQTAAEEECDLIVVGSRLVSGFKRLMVGRTVNAVAAKAPQPVLVVKAPPAAHDDPALRRLLVATGGSPWSDAAVEHALRLARAQHLEVCLLHVTPEASSQDTLDAAADKHGVLALAEARAAAAGVPYELHLARGHVVAAILETAQRRQCDAIVLGTRGLTGWKRLMIGSISNAVTAKAPQPVLIVKRFLYA